MKTLEFSSLLILSVLLMTSCSEQSPSQVPVFELSGEAEPQIIDLSEIMDIDKIVPLETGDDHLATGFGNNITPAGDYLLLREGGSGQQFVQQYTMDGEFVRILINSGRGPNEVIFLVESNMAVDFDNKILYFSDAGDRKHIKAIDLKTGAHLNRIPLPDIGAEEELPVGIMRLLVNDTLFAVVPWNGVNNKYSFYFMDNKGNVTWGIPASSTTNSYNAEWVGDEIHFNRTYLESVDDRDTIYTLTKNGSVGISSILTLSTRELDANETVVWLPILEGPTRIVARYQIQKGFGVGDGKLFLIDKVKKTSKAFNRYKIDFLGGMEGSGLYIGTNGNRAALKIDAYEFRQYARKALQRNNLEHEVRSRLEDLMSRVDDFSNPIVLVGTLK